MPSSVGLWAGAYAEGLLDTIDSLSGLWALVDRSPLGSAAGYGVPLPLPREVAARALGFGGLDRNVPRYRRGRGKLEAAALFWCTQLSHDLGRLSQDVILFTGEEFGYLILPGDLATGSSIMPHKRNPDLFELPGPARRRSRETLPRSCRSRPSYRRVSRISSCSRTLMPDS